MKPNKDHTQSNESNARIGEMSTRNGPVHMDSCPVWAGQRGPLAPRKFKENFLQHYQPLHDRFLRYCASRAYGLLSAEDLAQEAILAALKGYEGLRDKDKLLGYLIGTVNNLMRNYNRRQRFSAEWDEQQMARLESKLSDPSLAADIHYLHQAIAQLPEDQREALTLFAISGFRIKEIAAVQQVSPGAVKTRISRARSRLRELLRDEESHISLRQRLAIYTSILL